MRRRAFLLLGLGSLAGCATAAVPPTPQVSGPTSIRFQSLSFQNPTVAATKRIVADWNAAHPDVAVRLTQGSFDSVHNQLVTQFMAGSAPDVIHDESADVLGFARQGYIADLAPHLSPAVRAAVPQGLWDTVTLDGQIIGVPIMMQSYVVFANVALLERAGVAVPGGPTLSWDALAATARQATTGTAKGLGWGLRQPTATVMSLGMNFGGRFFTGTADTAAVSIGDAELEAPRRIHAMAWTDGSLDTGTLTQSGSDVLKGFLNGRYAMIVGGSFLAQQLTETAPPGFRWTVLPALAGTSPQQAANPQTLSVSVDSPAIAQSARFIENFVQPANLAAVTQAEWLIPSSVPARDAIAAATGGQNGWAATLAGAQNMVRPPFQSVTRYPLWKDQIATPALQRYLGKRTDLAELRTELTEGWQLIAR